MSVLPIRLIGDPVLRAVATPVGEVTDKIRVLAADMIETMYDAPGRGLAAPQVGVSLRMFVMDCHWKDGVARDPVVMIDPQFVSKSETTKPFHEGCLSIPGIAVEVVRPAEITLRWRDLDGVVCEQAMTGFEAVCAQHEYDHLDGVLNTDRLSEDEAARVAEALAALQTS
jgi:peptide deformylase